MYAHAYVWAQILSRWFDKLQYQKKTKRMELDLSMKVKVALPKS